MNTFKLLFLGFLAIIVLGCSDKSHAVKTTNPPASESEVQAVKIENLLRDSLELADGVEIVVSYLELPKNTTLPAHYHPGEEFVYMLEGSGELSLKDQSKIVLKPGDVFKVPFKQIHSFSTLNEDVKAVVYRVHESGQPDRILVEEN